MPNIWTHTIFGQELLEEVGLTDIISDPLNKNLFNLGCQGPDILFYHNFLPWKKKSILPTVGEVLHTKNCGPFLTQLVQSIENKDITDSLSTYVLGFITHHILDRNMHPFIFYKSGFKKWNHQRYEIIMDTLIVQQKLGLETWKTPVWKQIYVGAEIPATVATTLNEVLLQTYPEFHYKISISDWDQSYNDIIRAQKLFHDPYRIKRVLTFGKIEPFLYKRKNKDLDYLNVEKQSWNCPTALDEIYQYDVWELWEIARADGKAILSEVINIIEQAKSHIPDYTKLRQALGNRSYDTGKACEDDNKIQYVNPII